MLGAGVARFEHQFDGDQDGFQPMLRDHYWRPSHKRLGIRWRKPYNCRHTYATVALMAGVAPAYIAAQLGHSVKMLLEKYALRIPENDTGAARAMLMAAMGGGQNSCQILAKKTNGAT